MSRQWLNGGARIPQSAWQTKSMPADVDYTAGNSAYTVKTGTGSGGQPSECLIGDGGRFRAAHLFAAGAYRRRLMKA